MLDGQKPAAPREKLIEVSIPLEAINAASAREKSIRHGHPSTLHLWWARRPLAACRAVLFAQLVDDPSSWPDRFPTEEDVEAERRRLHKLLGGTKEAAYKDGLVAWESSNNEHVLNAARWEIARSVAWGLGEEPPSKDDPAAVLDYLQTVAPPVYDPFSGGGSIPLEAQRLGLRAYGSDLNPVAVLIGKALVEIPPKFANRPPVNPEADRHKRWKGTQGLAEDVRYYGQWMRDEAERRIGHLYPKGRAIRLPKKNSKSGTRHVDPVAFERWKREARTGTLSEDLREEVRISGRVGVDRFLDACEPEDLTVIAWFWARTVRSPDPSAKGAHVPLISSFMLSTKEGRKAWLEPVIDSNADDGWRFEVRTGKLTRTDEERLKQGTKKGRGEFACLISDAPITDTYARGECGKGRGSWRPISVVCNGARGKIYCSIDAAPVPSTPENFSKKLLSNHSFAERSASDCPPTV